MKNLKKINILLVSIIISACGFAQKNKGDNFLTVGGALTWLGSPSFNAAYDYGLSKEFSLGAAANYTENFDGFSKGPNTLSRTNIGLRFLTHLGKNPNLDFYAGARLSASIWAGSGTVTDLLEITRKGGEVIPTAQAVIGLRFMAFNWIGVSPEIALGYPYTYSIGLSYNLASTKKERQELKDIKKAEELAENAKRDEERAKRAAEKEQDDAKNAKIEAGIIPNDKKSVVKLNLSIGSGIGPAYERYLKKGFAVEIGSLFHSYNSPIQSAASNSNAVFSESDSLHKGIKVYGLVKYYFNNKHNRFPKGLYAGASYSYINSTDLINVADLAAVKNPVSFNYEKNTEQHLGTLIIGYQLSFAKHFTADLFAGLQSGIASLKSVKYLDAQASEQKFISYFGQHQTPLQPTVTPFMLKLSIGYIFK